MSEDLITDSPDLGTMIGQAIDSKMVDVHTSMPGRVESYDSVSQTASIRPQLKRVLRRRNGDRVAEELPVIPRVSVRFPRVAGFFIHFPVKEGDFGTLEFSEYCIARWRTIGDVVDPGDTRRHDLSGAIFVPGVFPASMPIADADPDQMRLGADGVYVIEINSAGEVRFPHDATTLLARADRVDAGLQTIVDAIVEAPTTPNDGGALFKTKIIAALSDPVAPTASDTVKGT